MEVVVRGHNLPGGDVYVALQDGTEPVGRVSADADSAEWRLDVRVVELDDGGLDFRGTAVHGKRGERFLYLTWGEGSSGEPFAMFRRAKLMLNRVDVDLVRRAMDGGGLVAEVDLTDERGGPRCARVDPPAIQWSTA